MVYLVGYILIVSLEEVIILYLEIEQHISSALSRKIKLPNNVFLFHVDNLNHSSLGISQQNNDIPINLKHQGWNQNKYLSPSYHNFLKAWNRLNYIKV